MEEEEVTESEKGQ